MSRPVILPISNASKDIRKKEAVIATRITSTLFPFTTGDQNIEGKPIPNWNIFLQDPQLIAESINAGDDKKIERADYIEFLNHLAEGYPKDKEDLIKKKIEETFGLGVEVDEESVQGFFEAVPDDFTFSEGMRHILAANKESKQDKLILSDHVFGAIGNDSNLIKKLSLSAFSDDVLGSEKGAEIFIPTGNGPDDIQWQKVIVTKAGEELKLEIKNTGVQYDDKQVMGVELSKLIQEDAVGLKEEEVRFFSCNGKNDFLGLTSEKIKGVNYADSLHLKQEHDASLDPNKVKNDSWPNVWHFKPYNNSSKDYDQDYAMEQAGEVIDWAKEQRDEEEKRQAAAIEIQRRFRGLKPRRDFKALQHLKNLGLKRDERGLSWEKDLENFFNEDGWEEKELNEGQFNEISKNEINFLIPEIQGQRTTDGRVIIQQYEGNRGLYEFSDQVARSAENIKPEEIPAVSLAIIKDFNLNGGNENLYCLATRTKRGTTENFVSEKTFKEITQQSVDEYERNLGHIAKFQALEQIKKMLQVSSLELRSGGWFEERINWIVNQQIEAREEKMRQLKEEDEEYDELKEELQKWRDENGELRSKLKFDLGGEKEEQKFLSERRKEIDQKIAELDKILNAGRFLATDSAAERVSKIENLQNYLEEHGSEVVVRDEQKVIKFEGKEIATISAFGHFKSRLDELNEHVLKPKEIWNPDTKKGMRVTTAQKQEAQKAVSHFIAAKVWDSIEKNKFQYDLDVEERTELVEPFVDKLTRGWMPGLRDKADPKKFKELLSQTIPHSPYEGISILRPPGTEHTATVIFNGNKSGNGNVDHDTAYVYLKETPECYVKIRRCDRDGEFKVMRDGKYVREQHKKGDMIIDDGMIVHKNAKGVYEEIKLSDLQGKFGKLDAEDIKNIYNRTNIKAVSVGERLMERGGISVTEKYRNLAVLFNGKHAEHELRPKVPVVKVDQEIGSIRYAEIQEFRQGTKPFAVVLEVGNGGSVDQENGQFYCKFSGEDGKEKLEEMNLELMKKFFPDKVNDEDAFKDFENSVRELAKRSKITVEVKEANIVEGYRVFDKKGVEAPSKSPKAKSCVLLSKEGRDYGLKSEHLIQPEEIDSWQSKIKKSVVSAGVKGKV